MIGVLVPGTGAVMLIPGVCLRVTGVGKPVKTQAAELSALRFGSEDLGMNWSEWFFGG